MLRKDDSNKVLKVIKVIVFATSLSLLSPVSVSANVTDDVKVEDTNDFFGKTLLNTCIAAGAVNLCVNLKLLRDFHKNAKDQDIEEIIDLIKPKR